MTLETRTCVMTAAGILAAVSLVSPSSPIGWTVLAILVAAQVSWAVDRVRKREATVD